MLKTKRFVKPDDTIRRSKNQLGNTLIPVIIALAISAVASVAFLKQGADLSAKAKILEAQYEIADLLQQWNRIKSTTSNITQSDLPATITTVPNWASTSPNLVLGSPAVGLVFGFVFYSSSNIQLQYIFGGSNIPKECYTLASMFSSDMEGIASNPTCKLFFNGAYLEIKLN